MPSPYNDPNCQKYIDDQDRHWYSGRWMTMDQIERARSRRQVENMTPEQIERDRERVRVGGKHWAARRRRELGAQRARIIQQLEVLANG